MTQETSLVRTEEKQQQDEIAQDIEAHVRKSAFTSLDWFNVRPVSNLTYPGKCLCCEETITTNDIYW